MVLLPRLNYRASSLTTSSTFRVAGQACWLSQHHSCPVRELMSRSVYHDAAAPGQIPSGILKRFLQTLQDELGWRLLLSMISSIYFTCYPKELCWNIKDSPLPPLLMSFSTALGGLGGNPSCHFFLSFPQEPQATCLPIRTWEKLWIVTTLGFW